MENEDLAREPESADEIRPEHIRDHFAEVHAKIDQLRADLMKCLPTFRHAQQGEKDHGN